MFLGGVEIISRHHQKSQAAKRRSSSCDFVSILFRTDLRKSINQTPSKQAEAEMDARYPDGWRDNPDRLREFSQIKKRFSRTR